MLAALRGLLAQLDQPQATSATTTTTAQRPRYEHDPGRVRAVTRTGDDDHDHERLSPARGTQAQDAGSGGGRRGGASQGAHVGTNVTVSGHGDVSPPVASVPSGVGVAIHVTNHGGGAATVALRSRPTQRPARPRRRRQGRRPAG